MAEHAFELRQRARCLAPVAANEYSWLVASCSVLDQSSIHCLAPERGILRSVKATDVAPGVVELACDPSGSTVATVNKYVKGCRLHVWTLGNKEPQEVPLRVPDSTASGIAWDKRRADRFIAGGQAGLRRFQLADGEAQEESMCVMSSAAAVRATCPHAQSPDVVACCSGQEWRLVDFRVGEEAMACAEAHCLRVRHVDMAAMDAHLLASCAEDGRVRVWDTRSGGTSSWLHDFQAHDHWVWTVKFCPSNSALLLSASSDGSARVCSVEERSSTSGIGSDWTMVKQVDHAESMYCAHWNSQAANQFACLSYDGYISQALAVS